MASRRKPAAGQNVNAFLATALEQAKALCGGKDIALDGTQIAGDRFGFALVIANESRLLKFI